MANLRVINGGAQPGSSSIRIRDRALAHDCYRIIERTHNIVVFEYILGYQSSVNPGAIRVWINDDEADVLSMRTPHGWKITARSRAVCFRGNGWKIRATGLRDREITIPVDAQTA